MVIHLQCASIKYNRFLSLEVLISYEYISISTYNNLYLFLTSFSQKKKNLCLFHWDLICIWKERLKYMRQFNCVVEI